MTCEPHKYLMSRVAGYDSVDMPSVDFDISSQYNKLAQTQYQRNDIMLPNSGGMFYAPVGEREYQAVPQTLYDFGSVRSPAIGAVQSRRQDANTSSADIADLLPVTKQANSQQPTQSFVYFGITTGGDYSMAAANVNQHAFETGRQDLARAVLKELETLDNRQVLLQMN